SFINAIANLCDRLNANVDQVAEAMGMDKRIGRAFLNAGAGYGGSCFPKDVEAFMYLASQKGYDFELLKAVKRINEGQKTILFNKIKDALWIIKNKTIGVLGLSFKPDTDDIRSSVAVEIITMLQAAGAKIKAYDPQAIDKAKDKLNGVDFCRDAYEAAEDSDCLLIVTEWDEFRSMDLMKIKRLLRQPVIIDGRNIFKPSKMKQLGFMYKSIGRGS
ncbi:MAG: nucleotide sugar dehydrogenase, partial [Candidatus Omnitrophica bacterium]|nr:nucleotide sugar dehydrogenase [Candidatus Omnitrophota bacterium]